LLAAPFVTPRDADTRLSKQSVWLPRGDWFNFFSGEYLRGGRWHTLYGELEDIPVFAKAGAIVPLAPKVAWGGLNNPSELTIDIFPGADNRFELYEDDRESTAYQRGEFALTSFALEWNARQMQLTIEPAQGKTFLIAQERTYRFQFHGIRNPDRVRVTINGAEQNSSTQHDPLTETFSMKDVVLDSRAVLVITLIVNEGELMSRRDRRVETCRKLLRAFRMESETKKKIDQNLPAIFANLNLLRSFGIYAKDAHLAALTNVIESR
jgi:hypothetical protein